MSIDLFAEETFPLTKAAKRLPRLKGDRPVHVSTLWRWATRGIRGIRLETIKIGHATCTSARALREFFQALSHTPDRSREPLGQRHERVEKELTDAGI